MPMLLDKCENNDEKQKKVFNNFVESIRTELQALQEIYTTKRDKLLFKKITHHDVQIGNFSLFK